MNSELYFCTLANELGVWCSFCKERSRFASDGYEWQTVMEVVRVYPVIHFLILECDFSLIKWLGHSDMRQGATWWVPICSNLVSWTLLPSWCVGVASQSCSWFLRVWLFSWNNLRNRNDTFSRSSRSKVDQAVNLASRTSLDQGGCKPSESFRWWNLESWLFATRAAT